jgi:hypothetical protein
MTLKFSHREGLLREVEFLEDGRLVQDVSDDRASPTDFVYTDHDLFELDVPDVNEAISLFPRSPPVPG